MRYPLFLLLQVPPNDDNQPTQFGSHFVPDVGRTTQPMPSPYGLDQPGMPPPPPSLPMPVPWQSDDLTHAARPNYPPVRSTQRRSSPALIVGGVMVALALVVLVGAGFALAIGKLNLTGHAATTTTGLANASTVTPTTAPMRTPTLAPTTVPPTATIQAGTQLIPSAPQGFSQYVSASGVWGLDMPNNVDPAYSTISFPFGDVPTAEFDVTHHGTFVVYTFPTQLSADQVSTLLTTLLQSYHTPDIQPGHQGAEQDGQNTWQSVQFTVTNGDQKTTTQFLYSTHGSGSVLINMSASADTFAEVNQKVFQEMLNSFTYLH